MLDLRLEFIGIGMFRTAYHTDFEEAEQSFKVGDKLRAQLTHQRSIRQNNYFHALVQQAWENQRSGKRLPTWRHLRSHLLIMAGHCTEVRVSCKGMPKHLIGPFMLAHARVVKDATQDVEISWDQRAEEIVYRRAKSWSFRETSSDEATKILDRVIDHICTEIVPGMDVTRFTREARLRCGGKAEAEEAA